MTSVSTSASAAPRQGDEIHSLPAPDTLCRIVESGVQAPSAENRHFFRFERQPASLRLLSTDTGTWPAQPHRRALALISYGAVVENMALRAAELGLGQVTRWFPDPQRAELIADIAWRPADSPPEALASAIARRHSNRRFYRREPLPPSMLQRLSSAADAVPGAGVTWPAEAARGLALRALRMAESERFRRRLLHQELFGAVRFDAGWKQTTDEGLPPGALEVELPMRAPFAVLRHWPLMRAGTALGVHHTLGLRAADLPCRLAPHIGVLVVDSVDADTLVWVQAGRALQRVWLAATLEGLGFQAMAAPVALSVQHAGGGWVSAPVQAELRRLLAALREGREGRVCMFFRIGRASAPTVVTSRPPIARYMD